MIRRVVKMSFIPEKTGDFKKVFWANRENILNFEGCSHVELLQDINNPSVFFTYSLWDSEDSLNKYRGSELFGRVWSATKVFFNDRPQAWSVSEVNPDQ